MDIKEVKTDNNCIIELTEGDLYLLGFALNDLRKHAASPQVEAGASEMLRQIHTII